MSDIDHLKRCAASQKGWFTRAVEKLEDTLNFLDKTAVPTPKEIQDLDDHFAELEVYGDKLIQHYDACQEADDLANVGDWEAKKNAIGDQVRTFRKHVRAQRAKAKVHPSAPLAASQQATASGGTTSNKVVEVLKPQKINKECKPAALRAWVGRLRSYFRESGAFKAENVDQQTYFFHFVDLYLEGLVRAKSVDDSTPVFGPGSCMEKLEQVFHLLFPVFARRLEFFQSYQKQGQAFSDFSAKLRAMGDEADLAGMTREDIYMFRYLVACRDEKLRERLLKLENPTLDMMDKEVMSYETQRASLKAMDKADGQSRGVQNQAKKVEVAYYKAKREGLCLVCGYKGHKADECSRKDSVTCQVCHRKGHLPAVCRKNKVSADPAERSKSQNRGRARSKNRRRFFSRQRDRQKSESGSSRESSPERRTDRTAACRSVLRRYSKPTPKLKVSITSDETGQSFSYKATPDSGCTRTIIAFNVAQKNSLKYRKTKESLIAANGERMRCEGSIKVRMSAPEGGDVCVDAIISSSLKDEILISWHDLQKMGILSADFPAVVSKVSVSEEDAPEMTSEELLESLKEEFVDVLCDDLPEGKVLDGPPMKIHLRTDKEIKPKRCYTARLIPKAYQEEADRIVQSLLKSGVLVKVDEPTDWVAPAHFVPKPGGKGLRLVTDYTTLNEAVKRPIHPFPAAHEVFKQLDPDAEEFAGADALWGYYQVLLDNPSSFLTTFLLPSGRYRYTRAPMGLNASSDEWCYRSDAALQGLEGTIKLVDDILVQAPNKKVLKKRMRSLLTRCREKNLILSKKKLKISSSIKFAGHQVSADGVRPLPERLAGIREFPTPKDVSALRGFLGAVNQLGFFIPDIAHATAPLRELLKKNVAFQWLEVHADAFAKTKDLLTGSLLVKPFDPNLPVELLTDASRSCGLGYCLLQREENGTPRLLECGSRSLKPAEKNYATIELELLAAVYAMKKCDYYLRGLQEFMLLTDHRPLIGIFKKPLMEVANGRLQRLREKIVDYSFKAKWVPGKDHSIADALSRAPVFPADDGEESFEDIDDNMCLRVAEDPRMQVLFDAAAEDNNYKQVVSALREGKNVQKLPTTHPAQSYANVWTELSLLDDMEDTLMAVGDRVVVPHHARAKVLELLHLPHSGLVKTKKAAQQLYYWPGINNSIKQLIGSCSECQAMKPSLPKEPMLKSARSDPLLSPMSHVGVDLADIAGKDYLIMVDRYSGFPFAAQLKRTDTATVTAKMKSWFMDFGIPAVIRSDGGPQFRSIFTEFCEELGIKHETSSPYNPASNGLAEAAVKNVKKLLLKCMEKKEDIWHALLEFRNLPRVDGFSPAEMFVGRRQRTLLPVLPSARSPVDQEEAHAGRGVTDTANRKRKDQHTIAHQPLNIGQEVLVQHPHTNLWDEKGIVQEIKDHGKSYVIEFEGGSCKIRNRRYLRSLPVQLSTKPIQEEKIEKKEIMEHKGKNKKNEKKQRQEKEEKKVLRRSKRLATKMDKRKIRFGNTEIRYFSEDEEDEEDDKQY